MLTQEKQKELRQTLSMGIEIGREIALIEHEVRLLAATAVSEQFYSTYPENIKRAALRLAKAAGLASVMWVGE